MVKSKPEAEVVRTMDSVEFKMFLEKVEEFKDGFEEHSFDDESLSVDIYSDGSIRIYGKFTCTDFIKF